jgi:endonuclease/exonuclease/phosphatase family metal-dependent hydrolase
VDLDRIAQRLAPYDFVGLNEVRGASLFGGADQAQTLGRSLHASWQFHPFEQTWGRDDFGNAVLSHLSVRNWMRVPFPYSNVKGHGNLSLTTLDWKGGPVQIIVTHIDRESDRIPQLRAARQLFEALAPPVILMGDLNTSPGDPELADMVGAAGVVDVLTARNKSAASDRIDWILVRGLECVDSGTEDHGESDHPLVWAELRRPAPGLIELESPAPEQKLKIHLLGTTGKPETR